MNLTGREKATIFLSILGSDTSSAILRYLPPELSDLIASSLSQLPTPTPEALGEVFNDFKSYVSLPSPMRVKTAETSVPSYTQALSQPEYEQKSQNSDKESLLTSSSKKIAYLLADERPQIAAFILSLFPPMQREEILMNISSGREQIDDFLVDIKTTAMTDKIQERLVKHFAEKL